MAGCGLAMRERSRAEFVCNDDVDLAVIINTQRPAIVGTPFVAARTTRVSGGGSGSSGSSWSSWSRRPGGFAASAGAGGAKGARRYETGRFGHCGSISH